MAKDRMFHGFIAGLIAGALFPLANRHENGNYPGNYLAKIKAMSKLKITRLPSPSMAKSRRVELSHLEHIPALN